MDRQDSHLEDFGLIRAILNGEQESFTRIIEKYKGMVFNLAFRLSGNLSEAEDILQESFIRAYRNLKKFNLAQDFHIWLYTITINVCRSRYRRKKIIFFSLNKPISEKDEELYFDPGTLEDNPEEKFALVESSKKVQKIINGLPFKYRTVFVLRYMEEKSYQEISYITKLPLGTVKTYLHRGQKILCKKLKSNGNF